jgi:hypothetical protein
MTDLRTQLDAALGDPPRSTVDVDAIVRRQRRLGRLRVAGAGGATAAVLAGVVVAATALPGPAPDRLPAGSASVPASAPAAATSPAPTATATPSCPRLKQQLSTALQTAVRAEIGSTTLHPFDDNGVSRAPLAFFGGPCDPEGRNRGEYLAVAKFGPRLLDPMLDVYVQTSPVTFCSSGSGRTCATSTGPGGEVIQSLTERGTFQATREVRAVVVITKKDGTTLQLLAFTQDRSTGQPPLSVAQLTRIGLAPGLALTG